jgi:UDP-glucose 4-epimerase
MQMLVTGGAGFVGGHLVAAFLRDGHDVVAKDSLHPFYDVGLKHRDFKRCRDIAAGTDADYRLVEGDVRDPSVVDQLVTESDYVFHNAAQAGVRASVAEPRRVNDVNAGGTVTVLEAARQTSVERVVCAGSSSVYGRPEYLPYDEAHPTTPVSPYGVSKLASDHYARVYHEIHDVPTAVLRYETTRWSRFNRRTTEGGKARLTPASAVARNRTWRLYVQSTQDRVAAIAARRASLTSPSTSFRPASRMITRA